jgi:methylglyoxal synthase
MGVVHEITIWRACEDRPRVALVAHDGKKTEMQRLVEMHAKLLKNCDLFATRSTGRMIREDVGLPVECVASGPEGGDLQIGARIVDGGIDVVIFLRDPLAAHPHEPDIQALMKVCDVHGVPLATNRATAEILLRHLAERVGVQVRGTHPSLFGPGHFPWGSGVSRAPTPEAR